MLAWLCGRNRPRVLCYGVVPALGNADGSIEFHEAGIDSVTWHHDGSDQSGVFDACDNGRYVTHAAAGTYRATVVHEDGRSSEAIVKVPRLSMPTVSAYSVTHATTDFAHDGRITAQVSGMPDTCRYLWTSGVITREPTCGVQRTHGQPRRRHR